MATKNIVAEGDSWFHLPGIPGSTADILKYFDEHRQQNKHSYRLVGEHRFAGPNGPEEQYRHAYFGHTIEDMNQPKNLEMFKRIIKKRDVKAMIFSGGGNDLIEKFISKPGEPTKLLLDYEKGQGTENSLNSTMLDNILESIKSNYKAFIKLCKAKNIPLITHSYLPPDPTIGGYSALFGFITIGPWFAPTFEAKGYPEDKRQPICDYLIKQFVDLLDKLKGDYEDTFYYINLGNLKGDLELGSLDRADEIHLSHSGSKKVAEAFAEKLGKII